jgi:hypothetical protein
VARYVAKAKLAKLNVPKYNSAKRVIIEKVIMPTRIKCRDMGVALLFNIDIYRFIVIGRDDAMKSCSDRKPNLRILCGSM